MEQYHIIELLEKIIILNKKMINLLEIKQTAKEKHSGIGYNGL
jgi:hypothetical protein